MARQCRLASYRAVQRTKNTLQQGIRRWRFSAWLGLSAANYDGHITQPKPDPASDGQLAQPGLYMNRLGWKFVLRLALPVAAMLIFYGVTLFNASKWTLDEVHYLGLSEIVLGLISAFYIGYGLLFWAIGFGVLHIAYGALMWWRHDR